MSTQVLEEVKVYTPTQEEKTQMLRTLDSLNGFFESAINLLAFGRFRPTSLL